LTWESIGVGIGIGTAVGIDNRERLAIPKAILIPTAEDNYLSEPEMPIEE